MKKRVIVYLKSLLPLVYVVCALSGCVLVQAAVDIGEGVAEIVDAAKEPGRAKAQAAERAQKLSGGGELPFTNAAEERLTRRTSTLDGGTPVDVSPYLIHRNSFTVTEKGIQHFRSVIDFAEVYYNNDNTGFALKGFSLFEFDTAITFETDKQPRQMSATAAVSAASQSKAKDYVKKYMQQYAADRLGVDPQAIKKFKIQFSKARKGKAQFGFRFDNVFVHTIKPGYVQFDVEVEYQKKRIPAFMGFRGKLKPELFSVFNEVYRSELTSVEAAAIDVQGIIWKDARKKGFKETPLPVINFVRAASFTQ